MRSEKCSEQHDHESAPKDLNCGGQMVYSGPTDSYGKPACKNYGNIYLNRDAVVVTKHSGLYKLSKFGVIYTFTYCIVCLHCNFLLCEKSNKIAI